MTQKQRDELLAFLQFEQIEVQHIDTNLRLYLAEIAWAEAREALTAGDSSETLKWAEYCIRAPANDPRCEEMELSMRAWMIQNFVHQDEHMILDSCVLVDHSFSTLKWTPDQALQAAHDGWRWKDSKLLLDQRKIKQALVRLERIKDELPQSDQLSLQEWFASKKDLK